MDNYHEVVEFQLRQFSLAEITFLISLTATSGGEKRHGIFSHLALDQL